MTNNNNSNPTNNYNNKKNLITKMNTNTSSPSVITYVIHDVQILKKLTNRCYKLPSTHVYEFWI